MTSDKAAVKPVAVYRPVIVNRSDSRSGLCAVMTDEPDTRNSDWLDEDSRQWVKLADHAAALQAVKSECSAALTRQRRELCQENDRLSEEIARLCGVAERAMDVIQRLSEDEMHKFSMAEVSILTQQELDPSPAKKVD